MSNTAELIARARQYVPHDPDLAACWNLVVRGFEVGWLDRDELRDLLEHLRAHRDFGIEELMFAHIGDRLRVSILDDQATCSSPAMTAALSRIYDDSN